MSECVFWLAYAFVFVCYCMHISVVFLWMYLNNVCASVLRLMCANMCMWIGLCRVPLSVWNAVGWISTVRVTREGDHWSASDTASGPEKGSTIFSLSVGGKKPMAEKTKTNDQLHLFILCHPFNFPSLVVSHRQTLFSDYICNVHSQQKCFMRETYISNCFSSL